LFNRATSAPKAVQDPARAYAEAARWFGESRVSVQPASLADTSVANSTTFESLDHVAFAAIDPRAIAARMPGQPISTTEDSIRFGLGSGSIVEIVRDTDAPDAYWCPMHPDVRAPGQGKCRRCSMALVPIPPTRPGEYRLDVSLESGPTGALSGLRFVVREPETGKATANLMEVHERLFHLFVVSRDLSRFEHLHPERTPDGAFVVRHPFTPGQYMLIADFLPAAGTPQLLQRAIVTPDYRGPLFGPLPDLAEGDREQIANGLRIRLGMPATLRAGRQSQLQFEVTDATTGAFLDDLEPYLGAWGHLLAVNRESTIALHAHPEGDFQPQASELFNPVFPVPGLYKLWLQVQRKGQVVTTAFVINVE
jgi:hypothetical protein